MNHRSWACWLFLGALAGCGKEPADSYFPLTPGLRYDYRVSQRDGAGTVERPYGIANAGVRNGDNGPVYLRRTDTGIEYHLVAQGLGASRVATRALVEGEPVLDVPARTVLPAQLEVGAEWQAETRPYLLKRNVSDGIDLTRDHSVNMNYRIAATDATVEVPAGKFTDCVHVIGEARLRIFVDGRRGYSEVPLRTDEWYGLGVGLLKLERRETVEASDMLAGGELQMVLTRWSSGD